MKVATFADLMAGHPYAEIINPLKGDVVRKLSVAAGRVQIDAIVPPIVSVSLSTPITYQPWVFDRGSLLFSCVEYPCAKICTELDKIRYEDGTEDIIQPAMNR